MTGKPGYEIINKKRQVWREGEGRNVYRKKTSYDFLYLFRDVMRCGSFQKAAREADCTPASISRKIAQMESELGITLFEKGSGGMAPTAAGLYLYDKLDSILWNLDAMLQEARNIPPETSMKLELGITDMISGSFYGQLIRSFTQSYPDVQLVLSAPAWPEMRRRLIDGRMDAALTYSIGFANEPRLIRKPIFRAKPCIYYSRLMPVGDTVQTGLEAFRECAFICLDTDVAAMNMLRDLPFEPRKVLFADSLKSLYLYVNAGLACTVLGPAQQLHETEGIERFELSDAAYTIGIDIVWEKSVSNPAVSLLADCAERVFPPVRKGDLYEPI